MWDIGRRLVSVTFDHRIIDKQHLLRRLNYYNSATDFSPLDVEGLLQAVEMHDCKSNISLSIEITFIRKLSVEAVFYSKVFVSLRLHCDCLQHTWEC